MELINTYVVEKDTKEVHVVANVLFLYCDRCDFNFQVSAVDKELYNGELGYSMINNSFICPHCMGVMGVIDRKYGHFDKLNDYYSTTISC